MSIADDCIREIREWFRRREEAGTARHHDAPPDQPQLGKQVSGPPKPNQTIILKEDTRLELGHPSVGSCAAVLATHEVSLVESGRITLVGPDVNETEEPVLPFAQIVLAYCGGPIEDACSAMDRALHLSAQTDGFMLRSVPDMIWARVSKKAARGGFSLFEHGARLLYSLSEKCDAVRGAQLCFVTSSRDDVSELNGIIEPTRVKLRKLQTFGRTEDGTYECDTSLDCNECPEKPVCDTIRDVITIRKGDRIIRIGGDDDDS